MIIYIYEWGSFVDWIRLGFSYTRLYIDYISPKTAFLAFLDDTLFMTNQNLKRFIKKYIDFNQKLATIEDFKVDYSKKLLKSSIIIRIHQIYYRISYTKIQSFEILVVFSSGQLWSPLSLRFFDENRYIFLQIPSEIHLA